MSHDNLSDEFHAAISNKFEEDGTLQQIRCMLQSKMISVISGAEDNSPLVPRRRRGIGGGSARDTRLQVLDQLILEALHWNGYYYTADMFARECACENNQPMMRDCLESVLGTFEQKDQPILLELIGRLIEKKKQK